MLTRLYIDNFRCFVGFEYKPERRNLILGRNGSGKSSLVDALLFLRQFVIAGNKSEDLFPLSQRTRWLERPEQSFEIEAALNGGKYRYELVIEPSESQPVVASETIHLDHKPIIEFRDSVVQIFNDGDPDLKYPLDPSRSALLTTTSDTASLIHPFKEWLSSLYSFRLNPFAMAQEAKGESLYPTVNLSNIAAWYRHLLQAHPRENTSFLESLRAALDGFSVLQFQPAGENVRLLMAEFSRQTESSVKLGFDELSDGQRCLI
jgi:hypothetical protein